MRRSSPTWVTTFCTVVALVVAGFGSAQAADPAVPAADPIVIPVPDPADLPTLDKPVRPPTAEDGGPFGPAAEISLPDKPVRPPTLAEDAILPADFDFNSLDKPVRPPTDGGTDAAGEAQPVSVLLELGGPPAADVYAQLLQARGAANGPGNAGAVFIDGALRAELAAATQAAVAANAAAQAELLGALEPLGATVLFQAQRVHNGVAVRVDAARLEQVRTLPGVVAVRPLTTKYPGNARSVPFMGAPTAWTGLPGFPHLTGTGVRIAVIDTGVDYLHRAFGGPGTGYAENDTTVVGDVPGFPSAKIVGGYDFAGDSYAAGGAARAGAEASDITASDPDPMDCYPHGTHVAATAAGYGVTTAGATYTGPYHPALDWAGFEVGPGVAPGAQIYAVRVFGCFGGSDIVDVGIEYAVDPNQDGDLGDHVDVINMSLSNVRGDEDDTTAVAANRAAQVGVIVVASAGNSGDSYYVAGSPANATRALSVAAAGHLPSGYSGWADGPDTMATFSSRGLRQGDSVLKPDVAAPGVDVISAAAGSGNRGMSGSGTSMAAPHVAGLLALLRQLHPAWSVEELKALAMNTAAPVRPSASYTTPLSLPSRMGAGRADGWAAVRATTVAYDATRPGAVSVSFGAPEVAGSYQAERLVRVANKGSTPAAYTVSYAPLSDLPGVEFSAGGGPHLALPAGAAALIPVRLSADASLMENRPDPSVDPAETPDRFWLNEETGLLLFWPQGAPFGAQLLPAAETSPAIESTAEAEASARFDPLTGALAYTVTLKSALSSPARALVLGWGHAGVMASVTQTLPGGPQLAVNVPVTGQVALSPHDALLLAGGQLFLQIRTDNYPQGEARGQLTASAPVLRLPLHAAPVAVSALQAEQPALDFSAAQPNASLTRTLTLAGSGLAGSATPTETQSLMGLFELVVRSPNVNPHQLPDPEPDRSDMADLRFLGITSDYAHTGSVAAATVSFALAAWAPWNTPLEVTYTINVSRPGDTETAAQIYNTADLEGFPFRYTDDFQAVVHNWSDQPSTFTSYPLNGVSPGRFQTRAFGSSVMVLSVPAAALGLSENGSVFSYSVQSREGGSGGIVERTPVFTYDVRRPGLLLPQGVAGSALMPAQPGVDYPIGMDVVNYIQNGSRGLLVVQMHNGADAQAEVVDLAFTWPYAHFLPIVAHQKQ